MNMKRIPVLILALLLVFSCFSVAAETAGDTRMDDALARMADAQKDPWVKAILGAGAREVSWDGDTATFGLRGFDPDLRTLGAYAKAADKKAWREKAFENVSAYSLRAELTFEGGEPTRKSSNALINQVKKAAGTAKSALGKKEWTEALTDLLFCAPTTEKSPTTATLMTASEQFAEFIGEHADLFPCESASEWVPIFYVQRNWKYDVKQGPHRIKMTWDCADPVSLLNQAYDSVTASLASTPGAERAGEDSLPYLWRSALAEKAVEAKKGRLSTQSIQFDLDDVLAGKTPEGYRAYFARYTPGTFYERLVEGYRQLPAAAAQPLPKTGVLHQGKGRSVLVKVPKDGRNTYVQFRDADTGVIQGDAFIAPGKNVSIKVPEGVYVVQYAAGSTWYGTEETFGPLGDYLASDEFIVAKKKWTLVAGEDQAGVALHAITAADMAPKEDKSIQIPGILEAEVPLQESYPDNNPVLEGISSTTGLPSSGEAYTPILMVLDNAEDAYPHWGVSEADIIFQVPNAGAGATKLLGLFADHYPEQAGPVRSGRSTMLPSALSFDAAFAFAGPPAITGGPVDILSVMNQFGMNRTHRVYNLLSDAFKERIKGIGAHNLSCHIREIHENLIKENVEFEERPFLFTDEPRTEGKNANIVRVLHRGEDPKAASNSASRAVFKYDPEQKAYIRTNSSGVYTDRTNSETVYFANVIVLRVKLNYDRNYIYLNQHMVGSGTAEIFQNGKYVRGAWVRDEADTRLILVDEDGSELQMQRGKTFIVISNDVTDVIYSE